jgi:hypothetical protein
MRASSTILLGPLLIVACCRMCVGQDSGSLQPATGLGNASAYGDAQLLFEKEQYDRALLRCDQALEDALSVRIFNRIQALAIRCCLRLNQFEEALSRVELIYKKDEASPALSLLPLVWDDRLPEKERYVARSKDLESELLPRQLAAASSLLKNAQYRKECVVVLTSIRASHRLPLSVLAETQLWRIDAVQTDSFHLRNIDRWKQRADALPESLRAGPQFTVGRALQLRQKPNQAALELLWAPMMQYDDIFLAASGLAEAIVCLESTGRQESARRLRLELQQRFGHTSAARNLVSRAPASAPTSSEQTKN